MTTQTLLIVGSSSTAARITPNTHCSTNSKPQTKTKSKRSRFAPPKPPLSSSPPQSSTSLSIPRTPLLSAIRWDSVVNRLKYYADLASKLAEDGRFEDFIMIADSVVISGVRPLHFFSLLNVKLFSVGIKRMIKEGKVLNLVETALVGSRRLGIAPLKLFDDSAKQTLSEECKRILERGEVEEVVDLMEIFAGLQFSVKDIVEPPDILNVCVRKRIPSAAIRYARLLPHSQIVLCNMILDFGKKGDLVCAMTIFEASNQNSDGPNMYVYRAMIDVCGLCGDFLKSRSIYEELISQKVTPNAYVFNSLMNVNAHDLGYTLHVYKQMQNLGVTADVASYNIILKSCCLAARVDVAQDIYREVQQLELIGVMKLDVFTYSTMIKVFADAKLWKMALRIKKDMLSAGVTPNTITWSSLINACANAGLVEHAIQLFEEMLLAGCKPNSQCYNILLHACVESFQYDRAFRLFQSWKDTGFQNASGEAYLGKIHSNITAQTHNKSTTSGLNYKSNLRSFKPTTTTYNILMKACGTDYYHAKALMDEMKSQGLCPNHISWSILINLHGSSGNIVGAMQILKLMRDAGVQPDVVAYTAAIKVCVESKNLKLAYSLFAEMKIYQIQPNLVTYNTLLRARVKYGSLQEVQQCLAIYQDMRKAGYKSNEYYLKQIIEEWCEGVIQNENQNQVQLSSCNGTDMGGPYSLLLEKVAEHLQKSNAGNLVIDLQGLTKVEARIVVLAVLRMMKENFVAGDLIKDDMLIILGVQEVGATTAKCEPGVKDAIIKLLRDVLGLEILLSGSGVVVSQKANLENFSDSYPNMEEILGTSQMLKQLESTARRPAVLPRLKVTRESLCYWIQRRSAAIRYN